MKTSPLQAVKSRFGDKQKLVDAVKALATADLWLDLVNETKGLAKISNAKLIRLHDMLSGVKKDFGSRSKLIDSILSLTRAEKDTGKRTALEKLPTPQLVDLNTNAARRAKVAKAKPPAPKKAKKKVPRSKKAKAKVKAGKK